MTTTSAIENYLRHRHFKRPLVAAYERFEILSELGLQATLGRLLQQRLGEIGAAENYRVTCGVRLNYTNVAPDILIWRKGDPRFWIEIKDTASFNDAKVQEDWKKLQKYCCRKFYPSVQGGFFIYVARRGRDFPQELCPSTPHLYALPIILEHELGDKFESWEQEYQRRAHYRARAAQASSR
jgi:hypothetical protein